MSRRTEGNLTKLPGGEMMYRCLGTINGKLCDKRFAKIAEAHAHAAQVYHDKTSALDLLTPTWTLDGESESEQEEVRRTR